jgi:hypothetical protein
MTSKPPPVPPQNRSPKGPGKPKVTEINQARGRSKPAPAEGQGQSANTKQNTKHQGYQQDR